MSNRIEEYEVLINSHDPTTAIKISNDSEASRTLSFIDQTKVTYRFRFNRIDHATGVITKGVELATGEALEVDLKSTDGATDYISFTSPTNTTESAAVSATANTFAVEIKNDDDTKVGGKYIVLPARNSDGTETEHLFWWNDGNDFPPTGLDYVYHEIDVSSVSNTAAGDFATVVNAMSEFGASASGSTVVITAAVNGATTTEPEVSDSTVLGVSFTQRGVNSSPVKKYYDIVGDFGSTGSGLTYASGTTTKEAKFSVGITHASGATRKTVAVMDATVYKNFI
tara:strand:+ start:2141 stop:2989 length:849 start_codon:yes stop_codon:yes gene_type:complete